MVLSLPCDLPWQELMSAYQVLLPYSHTCTSSTPDTTSTNGCMLYHGRSSHSYCDCHHSVKPLIVHTSCLPHVDTQSSVTRAVRKWTFNGVRRRNSSSC
jgi:hypothetical protein